MRAPLLMLAATVLLSACGEATQGAPAGDAAVAAPSAEAATAAAADAAIVIRVRSGGTHPDRFCIPEWSIANRSTTDVGALLVELEWRTRGGEVLEPFGEFGALVEPFAAGSVRDRTLNGYSAACADLVLRVGRYACRDANAVRMPCPGAIRADTDTAPAVDLSAAVEGSMRGAVEAPQ